MHTTPASLRKPATGSYCPGDVRPDVFERGMIVRMDDGSHAEVVGIPGASTVQVQTTTGTHTYAQGNLWIVTHDDEDTLPAGYFPGMAPGMDADDCRAVALAQRDSVAATPVSLHKSYADATHYVVMWPLPEWQATADHYHRLRRRVGSAGDVIRAVALSQRDRQPILLPTERHCGDFA